MAEIRLKSLSRRWLENEEKQEEQGMKIVSIWGQNVNPNYTGGHSYADFSKIQACGGAVVELENGQLLTVLIDDYSAGERGKRSFTHIVIDDGQTMAEVIIDQTYDGYDSPVAIWKIASHDELYNVYGIKISQIGYELVPAIYKVAEWNWDKNPTTIPAVWTDANVPFAGWEDGFEFVDGVYDLFGKYKAEVKNGVVDALLDAIGVLVDYPLYFLKRFVLVGENEYKPMSYPAYIDTLYSYTLKYMGCGFFRRKAPEPSGARYACGIDIESVKSKPMPRR